MRIDKKNSWTEFVIDESSSVLKFRNIAGLLQYGLDINFHEKLDDSSSSYWDFFYKDRALTLHYNIYSGTSIIPKALTEAAASDNQKVEELAEKLTVILEALNNPGDFVGKYFDPEPDQWGLRGDPHLWRDMKLKTLKTIIPATSSEFEQFLLKLFKELTGEEPHKGKEFYVKKYATYGMSKGFISSDFWLEKGFPLLLQRHNSN